MSESIPSSITGFAHRRPRADSSVSFTYMQNGEGSLEWTEGDEAIIEQSDEELHDAEVENEFDSSSRSTSIERRKSSGFSRVSVEDPLLRRHDSTRTDMSSFGRAGRSNQKIYILAEDLTIVVSGFVTSLAGYACYVALCILSCGLAYLLFRWLPRWRVRLVGEHELLRDCSWVAVEVSCRYARAAESAY